MCQRPTSSFSKLNFFTVFAVFWLSNFGFFSTGIAAQVSSQLSFEEMQLISTLSCDVYEIALNIRLGHRQVPKFLYHFGDRQILSENVMARTVPEKAWREFIMSSNSVWGLRPIRQGLYGTSEIDTNPYGSDGLMEIQLREECRDSKNVTSLFGLADAVRFKKWFNRANSSSRIFKSLSQFRSSCFVGLNPRMDINGEFERDRNCSTTILNYFNETEVKVVQDLISKSFYIRDRSCIENILGTDEELIELAKSRSYLWNSRCRKSEGLPRFEKILSDARVRTEQRK